MGSAFPRKATSSCSLRDLTSLIKPALKGPLVVYSPVVYAYHEGTMRTLARARPTCGTPTLRPLAARQRASMAG